MKKLLLAAVTALFAAAGTATAQVVEEKFPCYVEVAGYAERNVTPDTFYLSVVLAEKDSKGKISVENQQHDMIAALRRMGVDTDKQLTMVDMTGEYFKKSNTLITAHYRLKLTSAADVRRAYSVLSDMGISTVSMRSVSYSKMDEVRNEVRMESIENARRRAAMLAGALGQQIGDCIRISDYSRDVTEEAVVTYNSRAMKMDGNAYGMIDEDIDESPEFKPIKVTGNVNARFVLLGANGKPVGEWPSAKQSDKK